MIGTKFRQCVAKNSEVNSEVTFVSSCSQAVGRRT